ncbi:MAG: alanine dehydrogenase, partial [Calditrichaeota bacterium]
MVLGIPGEIHQDEFRVGASPFLVGQLVQRGHQVLVETGAGERSLYSDADYQEAGAVIVPSPEKLYGQAECILKVRKPRPVEYDLIRPDHILLAYFHPLTNIETTRALLARGCSCFAYEQFTDQSGRRPLLELEGQLTGQLAVQFGACLMPVSSGGRGTMLGAFPGVTPPQVVILGTTPTGVSAAISAARLGANVFLMADGDAACS